MGNIIYSATGCARCNITKKYMQENGIDYKEFDIKADGKDAFAKFYRDNRKNIFRDEKGIEFPVFTNGNVIRQGVGVIIAYLAAQDGLTGFIGRNQLHGEWLDGINVSGGNPEHATDLYAVLSHLKKYGLNIELFSNGKNHEMLEYILKNNLADRCIMEISQPVEMTNHAEELAESLNSAAKFAEYYFYTRISPLIRIDGTVQFITPEEVGSIAAFIENATGSKKHPYQLKRWDVSMAGDDRIKSVEPIPESTLFKYRTAARRYMVMTEIENKISSIA